jgi:phage shock protein PspC (stress-responsive transcriptional regulator)
MDSKRLTRDTRNKMLGGVCSGIGNYFGVDPTIVRVVWVLLALGAGFGVLAYIVCWLVIPEA